MHVFTDGIHQQTAKPGLFVHVLILLVRDPWTVQCCLTSKELLCYQGR